MPKHVWKCDHCNETNKTFDETNDHEKKCSFNPENKYCYTCSNYSRDGFYLCDGESYTCTNGLDMYHFKDVGGCKGWE